MSAQVTLLSIVMFLFGCIPAQANMACIEDWSTAVPVVREEGLASVETLTRRAKTKIAGDIVKVNLCKQGERYVYRLIVRTRKGKLQTHIVDAKEPFAP